MELREATVEQNSPTLAFFHALVIVEQRWDSKSKCRSVPEGSTGNLLCVPLLGRSGFPTSTYGCPKGIIPNTTLFIVPLLLAGMWWEIPAAMVIFLELNKLRDGKEKRENYG